jgi:hypothetical protein
VSSKIERDAQGRARTVVITSSVSETPGRRYRIVGNDLPVAERGVQWLGESTDRSSVTVPRKRRG